MLVLALPYAARMYRRATRELPFSALPATIADALVKHAASNQIELANVRVWITHSENLPAEGFFGKMLGRRANSADPDLAHDTVIVLHSTHALVATSGEKRGTSVLSVPLAHASVTAGSAIAARLNVPGVSDGISLSGFPGDVGRPGTFFVGLGPERAGVECARAVEAAIVAAKNPR